MDENPNGLKLSITKSTRQYEVIEGVVRVTSSDVKNPFTDARLTVVIRHAGQTWKLAGFCDSQDGSIWRIRYCPTSPGAYTYQLHYQDLATHSTIASAFECLPSMAGHGFVRKDTRYPMHFVYDDGRHVFLAGKTAWRLGCSPTWKAFIDQAVNYRMNVLRVGVECPYFRELPGGDCWVWGGTREAPDFSRFNLRQWQHWDEVLEYAFQRGLLIEACVFTGLETARTCRPVPDPDMERYWDYLLARWGAYPGILLWELYNEFTDLPEYQAYMARFFKTRDAYGRLVTTSAGSIGEEPFPHEAWNDILAPHFCTGSWMDLDGFYRLFALRLRRHGKPVYIDETGRVGVGQNNDDGEHRRKQYWIWAITGDYCNYHSEGGCHVTLGKEPGEQYWPAFVAFWGKTEWWRMEPVAVPLAWHGGRKTKAYGLIAPDCAVVYFCTMQTGAEAQRDDLTLEMPPGQYLVRFYTPSTGAFAEPFTTSSEGVLHIPVPRFRDDLALQIEVRDREKE